KHVIDAGHRDRVHPLGLDGVDVVQKTWNVQVIARRREGAWHREQRHLSALENLISGLPDGTFGAHDAEFGIRQALADLDRHGCPLALRKSKFLCPVITPSPLISRDGS